MENYEDNDQVEELEQTSVNAWEEIAAARKITFEDIKAHMTGPVLSVCLHIILITLLMTFIVGGPQEHTPDITVEIKEMDIKEIEKLPEQLPEEQITPDETVTTESTDVASSAPSESTNVGTTDDVTVGFSDNNEARVSNVLTITPSNSPLVLPGVYAGRTKGGIKSSLKKYGAPAGTDLAIMKALRWLKEHQNSDGSWGADESRKPAFTGLAILTFLAHGETPSSAEFGNCVLKGIKKLIEYSENANPVQGCAGNGYGHAIVTYALSESYGMTKIPILETAMNKMIEFTIKGMNSVGGFNYWYNNADGRCDMSVMGWADQAMKAAFAASSTAPGLEAAIEKAVQCIKSQQRDSTSGGFCYQTNIGSPGGGATNNVTAAGTLCLQLLGDGKSPEVAGGIKYLKEKCFACSWDKDEIMKNGGIEWALYRLYYSTQCFFQGYEGKGNDWKAWNKLFTTALLKNQKSDGHWESPASEMVAGKGQMEVGGEAVFKGLDQGIYSTTLCCLTMSVYFRFLPTFHIVEAKPVMTVTTKEDDGLIIK